MPRDDTDARTRVRLSTWFALATATIGVLLLFFPSWLPAGGPWVQLALGGLTLFLAFRARAIGMREIEDFDGRLSLLAAMAGFVIVFFAGQVALTTIGQ